MKIKFHVDWNALKNVIIWVFSFAAGFLIQMLGWTDQGTAFVWLFCVITSAAYVWSMVRALVYLDMLLIIATLLFFMMFGITFLLAWFSSIIFNVNFGLSFELITLGQVMFDKTNNAKK